MPDQTTYPPRILIAGAGAMGLVTGYHLQLGDAEVTYLVRPKRVGTLSRPQILYCYDDASLKPFVRYKLITSASEARGTAYDYVLLTLDDVASHSVEGVALLAELGAAIRDTSARVISGGIGFKLREHVIATMGLAEDRVMSGALGNLAHQVATFDLPLHPPTDPDLLAQAVIAYRHNNMFGFFLEDRFPEPAAHFAALYDASDISKCAVFSAVGMEIMTMTIFPMFAGSELMGWPRAIDLPSDTETWELTIAACREVASMYLGGNIDAASLPMTSGDGIVAHMQNYETEALPLDLHAFHAFHHGNKVADQHVKLMRDCIAAGESMGKPMSAMKVLVSRLAALHVAGEPASFQPIARGETNPRAQEYVTMNIDFTTIPPEGNPFAEIERVRARGPVFWSDTLHGWVVSAYDDVKKVLSDSANFTSENSPLSAAFGSEAMLVIDTPIHHQIRNIWAKPASVSGVAETTELIEAVVKSIVVPLAARLKAGEEVDLPPLLEAFVSEMITSLMGIGRKHAVPLLNWNRVISDLATIPLLEDDPRFAQRADAKEGVFALLRDEIADRVAKFARGEEPTDLISLMVTAEGRDGITASIVLNNCLNLVLGALDTTVRWTGNALAVLHRHPELLAEIRTDRTLLPQAIDEVMRFETIVQVTSRIVRTDGTVMCGQSLKQGDLIYALPGAANRDPAVFERPGELDIRRKPKLHLGFGFGMHICLGMNIARKEALTFINALFDAVPDLEIVECDYGSSWSLWGPLKLVVRAH